MKYNYSMPITIHSHKTDPVKLITGLALLASAVASWQTGHHNFAALATTYAAGFLFKPIEAVAEKLAQRPLGRLASVIVLEGVGWGAQIIGATHGSLATGTAINAATNIFLAHHLPSVNEIKNVIAEPTAALQSISSFLKKIRPSRSFTLSSD